MTDLRLTASLTSLMGHLSLTVTGLSTQWYYEGLRHLGVAIASNQAILEESVAVVKEGLGV